MQKINLVIFTQVEIKKYLELFSTTNIRDPPILACQCVKYDFHMQSTNET